MYVLRRLYEDLRRRPEAQAYLPGPLPAQLDGVGGFVAAVHGEGAARLQMPALQELEEFAALVGHPRHPHRFSQVAGEQAWPIGQLDDPVDVRDRIAVGIDR